MTRLIPLIRLNVSGSPRRCSRSTLDRDTKVNPDKKMDHTDHVFARCNNILLLAYPEADCSHCEGGPTSPGEDVHVDPPVDADCSRVGHVEGQGVYEDRHRVADHLPAVNGH